MTRLISSAENFETIERALGQINFSSFDYTTIKASLIEYVKLQYPESFNDFIESSEFISILEIFAYVAEQYHYRLDINASENFLSTAQRKKSILRLAKFLSYSASRNIPGKGLVKINTIKSTEDIFDSDGINLKNISIIWNDPNNIKWKDQFILVMNRVLKQEFGSVFPDERIQVDDVLFELYGLNNISTSNGVFGYNVSVSGQSINMELVSANLNQYGPLEHRPENNSNFSILYGSDGLGDSSDTTGFFLFTKQGTLQKQQHFFDGVTPNQTLNLSVDNINETDIWINNIDPVNLETLNDNTSSSNKSGEWVEVDISHAQNIIFNTNPNRNKYEVETLENDNVKIIFGDGEFADIPNGTFDIWFRTSIDKSITIPKNSVVNNGTLFNYIGRDGNAETFSFTYSLINSIQNNSASEDIEHIRKTAPSVYYTQDRMVNGNDYNSFMLQDTTILKLRSINRTFIGDSKYISWHDPKDSYESVKLFGDDLAIYYKSGESSVSISNEPSASNVLYNQIQPILSSNDFFTLLSGKGIAPENIRTAFTSSEISNILGALEQAALSPDVTLQLFYLMEYEDSPGVTVGDEWVIMVDSNNTQGPSDNIFDLDLPFVLPNNVLSYDSSMVLDSISSDWNGTTFTGTGLIQVEVKGNFNWTVSHRTQRIVAHSTQTRFWNSNNVNRIISYDTLLSNQDEIIVLDANKHSNRTKLISGNKHFNVIGQEFVESGNTPTTGLVDIHQLSIMPHDENEDNIPDNMDLPEIINPNFTINGNDIISLTSVYFPCLFQDISSSNSSGLTYYYNNTQVSPADDVIVDEIRNITSLPIDVQIQEYVYFQKEIIDLDTGEWTWIPKVSNPMVIQAYIDDVSNDWKRDNGRYPLNFLWMHRTPRFNLIDPASTNIIDTYIISRSYYTSVVDWITDKTDIVPEESTSLELRTTYAELIDSKMISDTMILHSGKIKILFGSKSIESLQAVFNIIRKSTSRLTDNQIKVKIIGLIQEFFDIFSWEFGETFYWTELSAKIHIRMVEDIKSIVLVPKNSNNLFGDLFVVQAREDEIFQPHVTINDFNMVENYTPENINQR